MNLHVTNDTYGLYPVEIAGRIKNSGKAATNLMVNLSEDSTFRDDLISYIKVTGKSFKEYIDKIEHADKVIFHPYTFTAYRFLKILLKKFPEVKVYWVIWSFELYNLPHIIHRLYEPFSANFIKTHTSTAHKLKRKAKDYLLASLVSSGIRKNYMDSLIHSHSLVHYFLSPLYHDFLLLNSITKNNISYVPFAYLSLDKILPGLEGFQSKGDKIMVGHSASPDGNHYEILQKLRSINPGYRIFLPLSYGNKEYKIVIKENAQKMFRNVEVLEEKLDRTLYYEALTQVSWAIINVKVQQGFGNVMALIWMGAKVFLDKHVSTYLDFREWGIFVFSVQDDLNEKELSTRLTAEQVETNKSIILEKLNDQVVSKYWEEILN